MALWTEEGSEVRGTDEGSEVRGTNEGFEKKWMPGLSPVLHEGRHGSKEVVKTGKKRPSSPLNSSRVRHWKRDAMWIDRCSVEGGENTRVLDISPSYGISSSHGRCNSVELELEESSQPLKDYQLAIAESIDIKEDISEVKKSANLASSNCERPSNNHGPQPVSLSTKWKKETKAELRRIIQQQESTWKIAEDAVDELGRRLELLERYKMEMQERYKMEKGTAIDNMDCFLTPLEENSEDYPIGYTSIYNSPIFEERKGAIGLRGNPAQQSCISPPTNPGSKDHEIGQLKAEVSRLRDELEICGKTRDRSPKAKSDLEFSRLSHSSTLPTLPVVPTRSAQHLSGLATPMTQKYLSVRQFIVPQEVVMEPGLLDDSFKDLKAVGTQVTDNGKLDYSEGTVGMVELCDNSSLREEPVTDNRSWVPIPEADGEQLPIPIKELAIFESQCMSDGHAGKDEISMLEDLSRGRGELQVLEGAVCKLAHLFWEQEGKLKSFNSAAMVKAECGSPKSLDLQDVYMELLKEMSQQLGELCQCLRIKKDSHEKRNHVETGKPMVGIIQQSEGNPRLALHMATQQIREGKINQFHMVPLDSGEAGAMLMLGRQAESISMQSRTIREALKTAERRLEEEMKINHLLREKLECGGKYLSKMMEEHAEEVARKDQSIIYAHELNIELAKDICQTEASIVELQSRYKDLVATLEGQLKETRTEVTSLQDAVNALKLEIVRNESWVSNLEGQMKTKEVQIQELTDEMQICQRKSDAAIQEKIELTKTLQAARKKVEEQHHHITELIRINIDLIAFSQNKEEEFIALTKTVKSLQQDVKNKSDDITRISVEAVKLSKEVVEARKGGETYRLRCQFLKSKLDQTEQDLTATKDSMERLVCHLGKTIEGQALILEEKEQLRLSLTKAQYKEHRMDDQVRHSNNIIRDLEMKLISMDAEIDRARFEMAEMKAREQESSAIEKGHMRYSVHRLQTEIVQ